MIENHTVFILMNIREDIRRIQNSDYAARQLDDTDDKTKFIIDTRIGLMDSFIYIINNYINEEDRPEVKGELNE